MQQPISTFLGIAAAVVLAADGSAAIINIDPGESIQAAITTAMDGDEIIVEPGTFNENINFLGKAITLRSSGGADVTIINGKGGVVLLCESGEGPDTVLEGFTITGGNSSTFGGGMRNLGSSPTVINCTFTNNRAAFGGGMHNSLSDPTVTNCTFIGNTSDSDDGGGMYLNRSSATVTNCMFVGNTTNRSGGGIYIGSGDANPSIIGCTFNGNSAVNGGGGIWISNSSSNAKIINCTFTDNTANFGGAIFNQADPIITNCLFTNNEAFFGGAMFNDAGLNMPLLVNCTITADNAAGLGGGIFNDDFTVLTIWNTIVRNEVFNDSAITNSNYSIIGGVDPLFVDEANGDFHLLPSSPAIDAGHNWAVPADSTDLDADADTTELIPRDLDGNPRFADVVATTDTGCGVPAVVDMGAYEFPGTALACLRPGDVNGDGTVNVLDLIDLLLAFGASCDVECCLADFDLSGGVDVLDLIELLLAFGTACP